MFMFGKKKKANQEEDVQSPSSKQRVEQSEREAEEKIVYFLLISLAVFSVVVIYLGVAKEFN
ncbi:hypothetical protein [Fictibacillus barbaricus]|uniref:Uncharacterized protein n=1 Tax=Fictibacillus barbaricus TaxID=182136 RepID=A0ABU1U1X5_9BACL|nr:hypothetical protein [Fictibacillus barbaricus]MDR7073423.1 hypothetical protein [Fictibacillus barbaricus]